MLQLRATRVHRRVAMRCTRSKLHIRKLYVRLLRPLQISGAFGISNRLLSLGQQGSPLRRLSGNRLFRGEKVPNALLLIGPSVDSFTAIAALATTLRWRILRDSAIWTFQRGRDDRA